MGDFVRYMHEKSGLLEELDSGITLAEAEEQVLAFIKAQCDPHGRPPLAGNSVATDRAFISRDMPDLEPFLHYRIVDVSSIKELSRRWFPRAYFQSPAKRGNHRALADIQESIEELRYYREAVFVPSPGPDTDTARAIANRHGGALTGLGGAHDAGIRRAPLPMRNRRLPRATLLCCSRCAGNDLVGIAQLVERRLVVADVAGSSPVTHPSRTRPRRHAGAFVVPSRAVWCPCTNPDGIVATPTRARVAWLARWRAAPCFEVTRRRLSAGAEPVTTADTQPRRPGHLARGAAACAECCIGAAAFALAAYVGRLTVVDGTSLSLVWPASGVAVLWFLLRGVGPLSWDSLALIVVTVVANLATGAPPALVALFVVVNLGQALLNVQLLRRFGGHLWGCGGGAPIASLRDLWAVVWTSATACLAGAVVGATGLVLVSDAPVTLVAVLVWWVRVVAGTLIVLVVGLLAARRLATHESGPMALSRGAAPRTGRAWSSSPPSPTRWCSSRKRRWSSCSSPSRSGRPNGSARSSPRCTPSRGIVAVAFTLGGWGRTAIWEARPTTSSCWERS